MKKIASLALAACSVFASGSALADQAEGPWLVRVRAVNLDTANKSDPIAAAAVPADAIHVANKVIPEVDISYFVSKNVALELVLTYPQKHDVTVTASAAGAFRAGSFKHLPPTLLAQYHFSPDAQFRPYVGAGINYTNISSVDLKPLDAITQTLGGGNTATNKLDSNSVGGALQIGFDVKVGNNSFLNFDVKKIMIKTDLTNSGFGKLATVKVDPVAVGIGYGFKF